MSHLVVLKTQEEKEEEVLLYTQRYVHNYILGQQVLTTKKNTLVTECATVIPR